MESNHHLLKFEHFLNSPAGPLEEGFYFGSESNQTPRLAHSPNAMLETLEEIENNNPKITLYKSLLPLRIVSEQHLKDKLSRLVNLTRKENQQPPLEDQHFLNRSLPEVESMLNGMIDSLNQYLPENQACYGYISKQTAEKIVHEVIKDSCGNSAKRAARVSSLIQTINQQNSPGDALGRATQTEYDSPISNPGGLSPIRE